MKIEHRAFVSLFAALLGGAVCFAQGGQGGSKETPLSEVVRLNRAPVSHEILHVQLPRATEMKLDDGLTVLVLEDHRLPLVTVRLLILGAGAIDDPPDLPGLSSLTAAMLREGTAHPKQQADRRADR